MITMFESIRKLPRSVSWLLKSLFVGLCTCYTFRSSPALFCFKSALPIDTFYTGSTFVDITTSWDSATGQHGILLLHCSLLHVLI